VAKGSRSTRPLQRSTASAKAPIGIWLASSATIPHVRSKLFAAGRQLADAIGLSVPKTAFITPFLHRQHTLTTWLAFGQLACNDRLFKTRVTQPRHSGQSAMNLLFRSPIAIISRVVRRDRL
jgi:hypothetical protein